MVSSKLVILLAFVLSAALGQAQNGHLFFNGGKYSVFWEINGDEISFMCLLEAQGWFALGFSDSGTMVKADMAITQVVTSSEGEKSLELLDFFSDDGPPTPPLPDSEQNLVLNESFRNGTHEFVQFTRKLNTGDASDVEIPVGGNGTYVIWAYSETVEALEYHRGLRGQEFVVFG